MQFISLFEKASLIFTDCFFFFYSKFGRFASLLTAEIDQWFCFFRFEKYFEKNTCRISRPLHKVKQLAKSFCSFLYFETFRLLFIENFGKMFAFLVDLFLSVSIVKHWTVLLVDCLLRCCKKKVKLLKAQVNYLFFLIHDHRCLFISGKLIEHRNLILWEISLRYFFIYLTTFMK